MNTVDILVLVVLLLNGIIGAFRGFVWQAFRLGSLVLAFWLGHRYAQELADGPLTHLKMLEDDTGRRVVAYVLILAATYGVMHLIGYWFRSLINKARLASADRSLGFLLGSLKGALFVALAFQIVLVFFPFVPSDVQTQLLGGPKGTPPASQAFQLHRDLLAERLGTMMPKQINSDLAKGLSRTRG